jgi:hypothetical protein
MTPTPPSTSSTIPPIPPPKPFMSERQLAAWLVQLGVSDAPPSRPTFRRWRGEEGLPHGPFGDHSIRYEATSVWAWILSRTRSHNLAQDAIDRAGRELSARRNHRKP